MTKSELLKKLNLIHNLVTDLIEESESLADKIRKVESELEYLPIEADEIENDDVEET